MAGNRYERQTGTQEDEQTEWLVQAQDGVWIFFRGELGEVLSWHKKWKKKKHKSSEEHHKTKKQKSSEREQKPLTPLDRHLNGIKNELKRERYDIMMYEVLPHIDNGLGNLPNVVKATISLLSEDPLNKKKTFHEPVFEYAYDDLPTSTPQHRPLQRRKGKGR